ncbi:gamma-glutamylcyclotransferase family protein [Aliidiomarina soli]|uniref:Gamma-glutamylcyclotransferase n=1 Tax=Aliidiomarina soli TaxID=1928574 RepID=A0A432WD99_9GAMM|nr:gamma-glutamylcyclotransferase family protein [Aliidiomarina soli]RUO30363.1 hypothetical protein CWE14_13435 [Aliidiomarina soli]
MFYFAYGSNMSSRRLLARVPSARAVGVAHLSDYVMTFRKHSHDGSAKCTIESQPGAGTLGVVYRIPEDQRYTLDRIEGQGFGYAVTDVKVVLQEGRTLPAFTYVGTDIDDTLQPYSWYKYHVLTGALEHGIVQQYVDNIKAVSAIEDPNQGRHSYELSIYQELNHYLLQPT